MDRVWDRNTKFFHGSTMIRRRRNKITSLQNDNRDWITDKTALEDMATTFFRNLYSDDPTYTPFILKNNFPALVGDGSLIRFWDHYWILDVGSLSGSGMLESFKKFYRRTLSKGS
ncbi:hypothetical protein Ahy_A03g014198 [Arachis hypogaea]|uniref:Uncharacterized protein n=1 Tax=Arachis hypogaea TaxID=3818 RepID=A0A445DX84_ARAHY|nr:hypothetical protein Ahy_A03g014198 [Arachis hypogaea]